MPKIDNKLNEQGYFTAGQILAKGMQATKATGWSVYELNKLVQMGVIHGRQFRTATYIYEPELIKLCEFIGKMQTQRAGLLGVPLLSQSLGAATI